MIFQKNRLTKDENKIMSWVGSIVRMETKTQVFRMFARFRWNYDPMSIHKYNLKTLRNMCRKFKFLCPLADEAEKIIKKYKK